MVKKAGVGVILFGCLVIIIYGRPFVYTLTVTEADVRQQALHLIEREGYHASVLEDIVQAEMENIAEGRITFAVLLALGIGLLLGGWALYRLGKKFPQIHGHQRLQALFAAQNKQFVMALAVFLALPILTVILTVWLQTPWLLFLVVLWVCCVGVVIRELIFFNSNFGDPDKHLVHLEYPNGDQLLITGWGLMKYNATPPPLEVSAKFEGIKWDVDNAKDLAESLIKQEGNPLMALLPSIEFSTTSNKVDDYIPFSFLDDVDLTFIEKDAGFLIISIKKKNYAKHYTLTYPWPAGPTAMSAAFDRFAARIQNRRTPVEGMFISRSVMEEITSTAAADA